VLETCNTTAVGQTTPLPLQNRLHDYEWENRSLQAVDKLPRPKQLLRQPEGSQSCWFPGEAENKTQKHAPPLTCILPRTHDLKRVTAAATPYAAIRRGIVRKTEPQQEQHCLGLLHTLPQQPAGLSQGQLCCRCSHTTPAALLLLTLQLVVSTPGPSVCC